MTVFQQSKRMLYWKIFIAGKDMTSLMREYVNNISITYQLNGVTKAEIDIISESYIEDIFVEKQKIKIEMGYEMFNLYNMFDGFIKSPPSGSGSDKISYRIVAVGKETTMANISKNRTFQVQIKSAIIAQITAENSYIPIISINDIAPIPAKYAVIQKNKTDLEMLNYCAKKWNCLMWFEEPNFLYFTDAEKAHALGDVLKNKRINIEDLKPVYEFGFRTDYSKNNIANISWSFGQQKGGGVGGISNTGANELGKKAVKEDFTIDYDGKIYKLKPALAKKALKDPGLYIKYSGAILSAGVSQAEVSLKKYWVPVTHGSSTHSNHTPGHASGNATVTVDMNIGDPALRPPRNALLYSGSLNPKANTSDLPNFLFRYSNPQKYKINEVTHTYKSGKLDTSVKMTLGRHNV